MIIIIKSRIIPFIMALIFEHFPISLHRALLKEIDMLSKNGHNQPGYQVIEYNKRIETSSDVSEKFKM